MRFRPILIAMFVVSIGSVACGRTGIGFGSDGKSSVPTPVFPGPTVSGTPVPVGTVPVLPTDFGDGSDGAVTVTGAERPTVCQKLDSGSGDVLQLADTTPFAAGDRVLVWQVQDDFVDLTFDPAPVVDAGTAGRWEIVSVVDVTTGVVSLVDPMYWTYRTEGSRRAQACILPQYTDVTIESGGRFEADDWNGSDGGVVAFFASGTVSLGDDVTASASGFRGGVVGLPHPNDNFGGVTDEVANSFEGAGKGEGLDRRGFVQLGRGNVANAGGGGNANNAGGGGGGNGGAGGLGGKQRTALGDNANTAGRPGSAVNVLVMDRLVMGGGGGGGHDDVVSNNATRGGNGGGVVLMFVNVLAGAADITATGESADESGDGNDFSSDGAGGGGAGGIILVSAGSSTLTGSLLATGGRGGNINQGSSSTPRGAGGGGGGGRIKRIGVAATATVSGGANGEHNLSTDGPNVANGATPGAAGVVEP